MNVKKIFYLNLQTLLGILVIVKKYLIIFNNIQCNKFNIIICREKIEAKSYYSIDFIENDDNDDEESDD